MHSRKECYRVVYGLHRETKLFLGLSANQKEPFPFSFLGAYRMDLSPFSGHTARCHKDETRNDEMITGIQNRILNGQNSFSASNEPFEKTRMIIQDFGLYSDDHFMSQLFSKRAVPLGKH